MLKVPKKKDFDVFVLKTNYYPIIHLGENLILTIITEMRDETRELNRVAFVPKAIF